MISKNNNKKIIAKLALNDLKSNKLRNVFVIFAVVLTSLLIVSVTSATTVFKTAMEHELVKMQGTSEDLVIQNVSYDKVEKFTNHNSIEDSYVISKVANVVETDFYERKIEIVYKSTITDEITGQFSFEGKSPAKVNEIVLSQTILDSYKEQFKIGDSITLDYVLYDELISEQFIISGIYTPTSYETSDTVFISKAKFENIIKNENYIFRQNGPIIDIGLYINNVDEPIEVNEAVKILSDDLGIDIETEVTANDYLTNPNTVTFSTKHVVADDNILSMYAFAGIIIFFIVLSGFLMISSIFESSLVKNMKTFAMLKTIGATRLQIRNILIYQGLFLSAIAIPISLVINSLTIDYLIDSMVSASNINTDGVQSLSFIAMFVAIVFSLLTVYISIIRSYKIINKKTPVEINNYNEINKLSRKRNKKISIFKIAKYNAKRNKFKYYSIVITLTIIPVLLSVFFTIGYSFDKEKFIKRYAPSDVIVRVDSILDTTTMEFGKQEITKNVISEFNEYKKTEEGSVYLDSSDTTTIIKKEEYPSTTYVIDEFPLSNFTVISGEIDYELLKNNNYVIAIENEDHDIKVGEKIQIVNDKDQVEEFEIMAIVKLQVEYGKQYYWSQSMEYIMSEKSVLSYEGELSRIVYTFNADDSTVAEVESNIDQISQNYKHLNFFTTKTVISDYENAVKTFTVPTTFLCAILLLIAISNYVNIILINVITKQKEYAIMKSIGLTSKQYRSLIIYEAMSAVITASILSIIIGGILNVTFVRMFISNGVVNTYNPSTILILPLVTLLYIVILLPIPLIIDKLTNKKSIVECIKE